MKDEQRSIPLPPELWQRLDELAVETSSLARRGVNFGKPSWRTMIRRIAEGEIILRVKSGSGVQRGRLTKNQADKNGGEVLDD